MGFAARHLQHRFGIGRGLLSVPRRVRHEFVGVVEEGLAGLVGERVVGEINAACGASTACRSGRATFCPTRYHTGHCRAGRCVCRIFGAAGRKSALGAERDRHGRGDLCRTPGWALAIQQQVTIRPDDRCFYSVTASWGNLSRRPWP